MNQISIARRQSAGFSLIEVIIVVAILAVLGGIAAIVMGDTVSAAKDNRNQSNAITMNKLMDQVIALGGSVGDGTGNDINTSTMDTVIACLTSAPPLNVNGISFGITPAPEAKDYMLSVNGSRKEVQAITNP